MINKIVLTGGPCAGKTTALAKISDHFSGLGYNVYLVPEVATLLGNAGVSLLQTDSQDLYNLESNILRIQIQLEDTFKSIAKNNSIKSIIIYDRGALDISAYVHQEIWDSILSQEGLSELQLRDARYDMILHMTTAAKGAEKFYTTTNNDHRSEDLITARELDDKIIRAWTGHPHLRIIENGGTFEHKINMVLKEITDLLGLPEPLEVERKYKVHIKGNISVVNPVVVDIFQTYLENTNPLIEERVRKRGKENNYIYYHTIKKPVSDTERIETEKIISPSSYLEYIKRKDPSRKTIHKKRYSFVYKGQYFELDTYVEPTFSFQILEIEGVKEHNNIKFPPFIDIIEDVTGNSAYANYNIATLL